MKRKEEKYFKHQTSIFFIAVGLALTVVGVAMILASMRTQYIGMILAIPGAAMWLVAAITQVKGTDLDKRIEYYTKQFEEKFYEGFEYTTKKVIWPKPLVTNGYTFNKDKYRFRRGSDGKMRTEQCFVSGIVDEKEQKQIMLKYWDCSVIEDSFTQEKLQIKYDEIESITLKPSEESPISKYYNILEVKYDQGIFKLTTTADAQTESFINELNLEIQKAKEQK